MNRHKRRAAKAQGNTEAWLRGIETVHRESGGVLDFIVVRPERMPELMLAAVAGDRNCWAIARSAVRCVLDVSAAAKTEAPKLCGSCPRELTDDAYSVVVAMPERNDRTTAITMAICHGCATTDAGIKEKAVIGFKGIWPDIRQISVHPHGGRA